MRPPSLAEDKPCQAEKRDQCNVSGSEGAALVVTTGRRRDSPLAPALQVGCHVYSCQTYPCFPSTATAVTSRSSQCWESTRQSDLGRSQKCHEAEAGSRGVRYNVRPCFYCRLRS